MELTIDKETVEIIDRYMESDKPKTAGLERICINELRNICQKLFERKCSRKLVWIKGEEARKNEFDLKIDTYFQGSSWYQYSWWSGRQKWGLAYFIHGKCERYFEDNSEKIISNFLHDTYGTIETSVLQTDSFSQLEEEFQNWFDERRTRFMEQTDTDIQKWKETCATSKPQSHGGVANLLKVLTKTMEKQGTDIANIAKVQYAVCVQAGIYIPDEFVRDVAIVLDMKEAERIERE